MSGEGNATVLITGGSGLIGRYLTSMLLERGYRVAHLSRSAGQFGTVRVYRWNPEMKILDPVVFDGIDYVVHLAGANIGQSRWTLERKKELVSSRVESAMLLHKTITENNIRLKAFVSASGVGYYGSVTSERIFIEEDPPANDFTGTLCRLWEGAADLFDKSGIRTVKLRSAVVLEKNDSALTKMVQTEKLGFLGRAGSGMQYMPWIHIEDMCNIYIKAIEDEKMNGAYNAVSPSHKTHKEFITDLGKVLNISLILPVPSSVLKFRYGEMADIILKGSRVSPGKIMDSGYSFIFNGLYDALSDIYSGLPD